MKDDFLTIPFAPNYEVNSDLIVRNKTTGYINGPKTFRVCLTVKRPYRKCKSITTTKNVCRVAAEKAAGVVENEIWIPVPSLNNQYELSADGKLRNVKTRHILKPLSDNGSIFFAPYVQNLRTPVYLTSLMKEVYDQNKEEKLPCTAISVTIFKDGESQTFKSLYKCSDFLSNRMHYTNGYMRTLLANRYTEICGWKVTYHEEIPYD